VEPSRSHLDPVLKGVSDVAGVGLTNAPTTWPGTGFGSPSDRSRLGVAPECGWHSFATLDDPSDWHPGMGGHCWLLWMVVVSMFVYPAVRAITVGKS
jgi:hypothetical protein